MSLYKTFKTDGNLEKDGIWLEYGFKDNDPTRPIRVKIARAGGSNTKFARVLEAKTKPFRRAIQTETLDAKLGERIFQEIYAEAVVLAFENIDFEETVNGPAAEDVPYSVENALRLFADLPEFWSDIREQASKVALFRQEVLEADAGN